MSQDTNIPKHLYHATGKEHIESIMNEGLNPCYAGHNFDWVEGSYIYLSNDIDNARSFAEEPETGEVRRDDEISVIQVDTKYLDMLCLEPDENLSFPEDSDIKCFQYSGIISSENLFVLE